MTTSRRTIVVFGSAAALTPRCVLAQAGGPKRIGVILHGGPYYAHLDGLRQGLHAEGLQEQTHYVLVIHDARGNSTAAAKAAQALESQDVALIVTFASSVTLVAKQATTRSPIVFVAGGDPVALGLVQSIARPAGRLTGVTNLGHDLTSKRLELLRELTPNVRRVATFYASENPSALKAIDLARQASKLLGIELVERTVTNVDEVPRLIASLNRGDVDAYFFLSDAVVLTSAHSIIQRAIELKIPTMAYWIEEVTAGALAGYGFGMAQSGQLAAPYVARILAGGRPEEMPVETINVPTLAVNMKTAKAIGLTIPPSLQARAGQLIE